MVKIERKNLWETPVFFKYGNKFEMVREDRENNRFLFKRTNKDGRVICYEIIRGVRYVNPDGSIVFTYPSEQYWGNYGWTIDNNRHKDAFIDYFFDGHDMSPQARYEFKMTLK